MNQLSSILPASDARANFYQIWPKASDKLRQFTIKLRGKDDVVILCRRSRGWKETLEIMSQKTVTSIHRATKSKKVFSQDQADKILKW